MNCTIEIKKNSILINIANSPLSILLGIEYTNVANMFCSPRESDGYVYSTLAESKTACNEDDECFYIYSRGCNGFYEDFSLCQNTASLKPSNEGSCIFKKKGNCISNL